MPKFVEVSQAVRAAQNATSVYRQSQLLLTPLHSLDQLKNSLAFSGKVWQSTAFGAIVEGWLAIINTARRTLEDQIAQSSEIVQPYVAGPALDPASVGQQFKGRQDLFREIETMVSLPQPPVLLLYGGRRTGKTSALKYLYQRVGPDIVPLLVDGQGLAAAKTLKGIAQSMALQIVESARKARNLQLPLPEAHALAQDPFPALQSWLGRLEEIAGPKKFGSPAQVVVEL